MVGWKVFILSGPDRKSFLQGLVTSDVKSLAPGRELPSCLLTPKGKLQSHFWTYEQGETLLLACPPETAGALRAGLEKVIRLSESQLEDGSGRWSVYWKAPEPSDLLSLPFSALGRPGWLVLVEPSSRAAFEAASGRPLSDAELERRRIESGWPRFGVDMDSDTIPLEARLDAAISYTKGCYMGQETISRIHHMGHVNRLLVGLRFEGQPPAAPAPALHEGAEVGRLSSACETSGGGLGLATVRVEQATPGVRLFAAGRGAVVVDLWS